MRFFVTSKSVIGRPQFRKGKKQTVTITSYNVDTGCEEQHKPIPPEETRWEVHMAHQPLASVSEAVIAERPSPLEELVAQAAKMAVDIHKTSSDPASPPDDGRASLLSGAFSASIENLEEEDSCVRYSQQSAISTFEPQVAESPTSTPSSPVDLELQAWLTSHPEIVLATTVRYGLVSLEEAARRPDIKYRAESFEAGGV